jgi:hypothetical protein
MPDEIYTTVTLQVYQVQSYRVVAAINGDDHPFQFDRLYALRDKVEKRLARLDAIQTTPDPEPYYCPVPGQDEDKDDGLARLSAQAVDNLNRLADLSK